MARSIPAQEPVGSPCKIAFVGEAPAAEELIEGLPMVGATGRVLAQMLRCAGLAKPVDKIPRDFYPTKKLHGLRPLLWERSDFWIGNVFDQRLPDDNIKGWCALAKERQTWADYDLFGIAGAGWLMPQYQSHLSRLRQEMEALKPNLIVPLGGTALWAFSGTTKITEARGAVGRAVYISPGTKILPTFHPANILYNYKMFTPMVADLVKAAREAEFPEIRPARRELWLEPSIEDIRTFKKQYIDTAKGPVAVDIETAAGQITCIGFAPSTERAICIPFTDYRKPDRSYWPSAQYEATAWEIVASICEDPAIEKLLQNGPYDCYWLWEKMDIHMRNYRFDTRLEHHALYQELPKSLGFMGAMYGTQGAWKLMRERKSDKRDE